MDLSLNKIRMIYDLYYFILVEEAEVSKLEIMKVKFFDDHFLVTSDNHNYKDGAITITNYLKYEP